MAKVNHIWEQIVYDTKVLRALLEMHIQYSKQKQASVFSLCTYGVYNKLMAYQFVYYLCVLEYSLMDFQDAWIIVFPRCFPL